MIQYDRLVSGSVNRQRENDRRTMEIVSCKGLKREDDGKCGEAGKMNRLTTDIMNLGLYFSILWSVITVTGL